MPVKIILFILIDLPKFTNVVNIIVEITADIKTAFLFNFFSLVSKLFFTMLAPSFFKNNSLLFPNTILPVYF